MPKTKKGPQVGDQYTLKSGRAIVSGPWETTEVIGGSSILELRGPFMDGEVTKVVMSPEGDVVLSGKMVKYSSAHNPKIEEYFLSMWWGEFAKLDPYYGQIKAIRELVEK